MKRPAFLIIAVMLIGIALGILGVGVAFAMRPPENETPLVLYGASVLMSMLPLLVIGTAFAGLVLWVCALVHLLAYSSLEGTDKIVWVLVIIFLNALGAVIYFAVNPKGRATIPPVQA